MPIIAGVVASSKTGHLQPLAPTIGTATDGGTGSTVSVAFTPAATGPAATSFTATSSPGGLTATGASSPLTVSGLTSGTAYTFTVHATNAAGNSPESAASNSVTPVNPANFYLLSTVVGSGTSITFSSIPSTYKSLQVRYIAKDSSTAAYTGNIGLQINGDTGANYTWHYLFGYNNSAQAGSNTSQARIWLGYNSIALSINSNGAYGAGVVDIIDYANTSKNKTVKALTGVDTNSNAVGVSVNAVSGLWLNTAAVTSLTLFTPNSGFVSGTTFSLYGVS